MKKKTTLRCAVVALLVLSLSAAALLCAPASAFAAADVGELLADYRYCPKPISFKAGSLNTGMVYSDAFFFTDSRAFSPEIAKMSACLAAAVYEWGNINTALLAMDNYRFDVYQPDAESRSGNWDREYTADDNDFVRYVIACKETQYGGEAYIIYCVPIRGTGTDFDWESDFNIGSGEDHVGFYTAREDIMYDLIASFDADGYDRDHRIVWTMGHSRGAAVSNIVAGELTEGTGNQLGLDFSRYVAPEHIFSYNFAAPSVSRRAHVKAGNFKNIYNINSKDDLIPALPLEDWGYGRYGVTIPLVEADRGVFKQRFQSALGKAYNGTSDTVIYVEEMINELIPNAEAANTAKAQMFFRILAFFLGDMNNIYKTPQQKLKDAYNAIQFYLADYWAEIVWELISSAIPNPAEKIEYYDTIIRRIPALKEETADLTDEEFTEWVKTHRDEVEAIEKVLGINIKYKSDIAKASVTVMEYVAHDPYPLSGISPQLIIAAGQLSAYLHTANEEGIQPIAAIDHGHMHETYVLWTNASYSGYSGLSGVSAQAWQIKDGVVTVGAGCFSSSSIPVVAGMDNIGYFAPNSFYGSAIQEATLDPAVPLGADAFRNCSSLEKVTMPVDLEFPDNAIYECAELKTIEYTPGKTGRMPDIDREDSDSRNYWARRPERYHTVYNGPNTSNSVYYITNAIFDEGVTYIGENAFKKAEYEYGSLVNVTLPSTLTGIGRYAFYSNGSMKLTPAEGMQVASLGERCFYNCAALSGDAVNALVSELAQIPAYCFYGCSGIEALDFSTMKTEEICESAFSNCSGLKTVILPEIMDTPLGKDAFRLCSSLEKVTMPVDLEFPENAIYECAKLKTIEYTPGKTGRMPDIDREDSSSRNYWAKRPERYHTVYNGPNTSSSVYYITNAIFDEGVTYIGENAFSNSQNFNTVQIPESVTEIAASAFSGRKDVTVYGYYDSYGEVFAAENNYRFIPLNEPGNKLKYDSGAVYAKLYPVGEIKSYYILAFYDEYGRLLSVSPISEIADGGTSLSVPAPEGSADVRVFIVDDNMSPINDRLVLIIDS